MGKEKDSRLTKIGVAVVITNLNAHLVILRSHTWLWLNQERRLKQLGLVNKA
jgi:hypothetical protein